MQVFVIDKNTISLSDSEKRATYIKAFGKEYDDPTRKQPALPLDLAYQVALHKLNKGE